ncbi:hypothetical protein Taro_033768 [Colocasia esculenta]|uniref:Uncharacterized protein n=1 Tax=Colocasia esculenta TaxID=4460 RepID=A0A843VW36_COLES|nr:hypothetical protein [Colocasia esculenta]
MLLALVFFVVEDLVSTYLSFYGIALVREQFRVSWLYPGRRSSDPIALYSGGDTFSKLVEKMDFTLTHSRPSDT